VRESNIPARFALRGDFLTCPIKSKQVSSMTLALIETFPSFAALLGCLLWWLHRYSASTAQLHRTFVVVAVVMVALLLGLQLWRLYTAKDIFTGLALLATVLGLLAALVIILWTATKILARHVDKPVSGRPMVDIGIQVVATSGIAVDFAQRLLASH